MIDSRRLAPVLVLFLVGCSKGSGAASDPGAAASGGGAASAAPGSGIVGALKNAISGNTQPFEGEIAINAIEASRPTPQTVTIQLKGQKIRFNVDAKTTGGQAAAGILDLKDKKMISMIDAQKKYIEIDFGGFTPGAMHGAATSGGAAAGGNASPPKIEKTGHHETVAGHDCEDWTLTDTATGNKGTVCMASDIGVFDFASMAGASFLPGFIKAELFGGAAFPIKFVQFDASGKEKSHVEATRIERKKEDDANFAPPAGYTKLDLGSMGAMGGFGPHGAHPSMP